MTSRPLFLLRRPNLGRALGGRRGRYPRGELSRSLPVQLPLLAQEQIRPQRLPEGRPIVHLHVHVCEVEDAALEHLGLFVRSRRERTSDADACLVVQLVGCSVAASAEEDEVPLARLASVSHSNNAMQAQPRSTDQSHARCRIRTHVPSVPFGTPTRRAASRPRTAGIDELERPQPRPLAVRPRTAPSAATASDAASTASVGHTMKLKASARRSSPCGPGRSRRPP